MIPNYYLHYYYHTEEKLREQSQWPPSRAEQVMQIEAELLRQYADPALVDLPVGLMQRGGAYYSTVATQLIKAHYNDLGETHIVNIPHGGAVKVVGCTVGSGNAGTGIAPRNHPASGGSPATICVWSAGCGQVLREILTARAAAEGDLEAAYQAFLVHPLGPGLRKVQAVLEDMLATNWPYLPQFHGRVSPPKAR